MSVVKATLKQKPVVRAIHEQLPRSFSIVESFGFVRIRSSKDDKSHVVASITGTPTVVIAIADVEAVTGSHGGAAIVTLRIAHSNEMCRVQTHEELEVNLFSGKLVSELSEKMLKFTTGT